MKCFQAFAALTLFATPVNAFGVPCNGQTSGFIQVGDKTTCIRKLSANQIQAANDAARNRAAAKRARTEAAAAEREFKRSVANTRQLGRNMDQAGDRILEEGGQERYRDALEAYTDASARNMLGKP